jgi:Ca2+-binding EF-hand superfamily protein
MTSSLTSPKLAALLLAVLPATSWTLGQEGKTQDTGSEADKSAPPQALDARERKQREEAEASFQVADYNGDGWISFREARESQDMDRTRFHAIDKDGDGRISKDEFIAQYLKSVRQVGAFKTPKPDPEATDAPSVAELLESEPAAEAPEPEPLTPEAPPTLDDTAPAQLPAISAVDLFGQATPREQSFQASPEPDRIIGPVPSFRRLDLDNDGGITRGDLTVLTRGAGIDVRTNAVLAALDVDGDGAISQDEFYASMSHVDSAPAAPR